jgi:iron complex outermembrane receptor protein
MAVHFQTETLTGLDFVAQEMQRAYATGDMSLTYNPDNGAYFVSAFANNVWDTTVLGNSFNPPLTSFVVGSLRPPRLYGIRTGIHF